MHNTLTRARAATHADQCIFLDSLLDTNSTGYVLSNLDTAEAAARSQTKSIKAADTVAVLENADITTNQSSWQKK